MLIKPLKTQLVLPKNKTIIEILDQNIESLEINSLVVISSKIISLCEGRIIATGSIERDELIRAEADYFLPSNLSKYGHHFSIMRNTIVGSAGIDQSNSDGNYVLWPADPQATANEIRAYLTKRFRLKNAGVIITDSISIPMRRGSIGTSIAHSGFAALKDYRGKPDLFDHEFHCSVSNIAEGLAAAAVAAMGEGTERTPLAIISEIPFVEFQDQNPTDDELKLVRLSIKDDLFEAFLKKAPWQKGNSNSSN